MSLNGWVSSVTLSNLLASVQTPQHKVSHLPGYLHFPSTHTSLMQMFVHFLNVDDVNIIHADTGAAVVRKESPVHKGQSRLNHPCPLRLLALCQTPQQQLSITSSSDTKIIFPKIESH